MLGAHFATVYVASGLAAMLAVFLLRRNDPDYRVLGASGAVTGVLFAAIVLVPDMRIALLILPIPVPAPLFALLYLGLSTFFMSRGDMTRVSHEAHVGGALAGLALGAALSPEGFAPLIDRVRQLAG
jgi:membrane associated rhomboid family serine protease